MKIALFKNVDGFEIILTCEKDKEIIGDFVRVSYVRDVEFVSLPSEQIAQAELANIERKLRDDVQAKHVRGLEARRDELRRLGRA